MNKIDIKTKWCITDDYWSNKTLKIDKIFDSEEEAEKYKNKNYYYLSEVSEVAILEGKTYPEGCKAYPIAVSMIKYKDMDGNLWDKEDQCEISNACHIINEIIGKTAFEYKKEWCDGGSYYDPHKKIGVYEFTIDSQSQIDALWVIYKGNYKNTLKQKLLLNYDSRTGIGYCDEIEKQKNRPKWINKLNNIQKIFDKNGSVICKIIHEHRTEYYHGEENIVFYEYLLVKLGKKGVSYIRKDPTDKTCKTCEFRGTDCGYTCKDNSNPRCYVEVSEEKVKKLPYVYQDSFDVKDVYDWNEVDKYDFDVNII